MYRDSFSETGWTRVLRALSASFGVGRYFRVEVRIFWITLIVMPLILLRTVEGWPFAPAVVWIAAVTALLYLTIWSHEMGHILAGRRYGVDTPLITLSPLGGLAHMSAGAPDPGKEALIAVAGPAVHIAWLALLLLLSPLVPEPTSAQWRDERIACLPWLLVDTFVGLNLWLLIFNLLPLFPMDGGRIFRALMARRMHPNRATLIAAKVGIGGAIAFMLVGFVLWIRDSDQLWGVILVCIGIANLGACRREILTARHTAGPYMLSDPLRAWQTDPDAWKRGASGHQRDARTEPGFWARRKERLRSERREREAAEAQALDREVDRILDRVQDVGMDGLTAAERKILLRASKRRRGD